MERLPVTVAENRSLRPVSLAANPEGIAAGVEQSALCYCFGSMTANPDRSHPGPITPVPVYGQAPGRSVWPGHLKRWGGAGDRHGAGSRAGHGPR